VDARLKEYSEPQLLFEPKQSEALDPLFTTIWQLYPDRLKEGGKAKVRRIPTSVTRADTCITHYEEHGDSGHLRGTLAFECERGDDGNVKPVAAGYGFWITHSLPKFL
jgi:hypothetical protein